MYDKSYQLRKDGDLNVESDLIRVELVFLDMTTVVCLRKISVQAAVSVLRTSMKKRRIEYTTALWNPIPYVLNCTECRPPEKWTAFLHFVL